MNKIKAVIFDWAGTTIDYGCFAPVAAFKEAFLQYGIQVTSDEIREPMGMLKRDHVIAMLEMDGISKRFYTHYGRAYTQHDVDHIYALFERKVFETIQSHTDIKPHVLECINWLRKHHIKIGSTTGYTKAMMELIEPVVATKGYQPDCMVCAQDVDGLGRPKPFMIFENMKRLQIESVDEVIKVGDTIADIQEAKNAGIKSVGIIEGSSLLGLSEEEYHALNEDEKVKLVEITRKKYIDAKADYVILNVSELERIVKEANMS